MTDWQGRTAIVTGAASGIGRAAASLILERGVRVVAVDLKPGGCDWVQEFDGTRARALSGDVTDPAVNAAAVAAAEDLGGLDAVLLNAGLPVSGTLESVEMAAFDRVIDVNLRAVVLGVRAALPSLRRGTAPAIAVTASVSGLGGDPGLWAYNAAKGGVVNFVRSAALELGRSGIRINAVCPGPIHTGMTGLLRQSSAHEALRRHIPLGRWGEAPEVAAVLVFLTSPAASFVNGAIVPVDGGVSASSAQFTPWGDALDG